MAHRAEEGRRKGVAVDRNGDRKEEEENHGEKPSPGEEKMQRSEKDHRQKRLNGVVVGRGGWGWFNKS